MEVSPVRDKKEGRLIYGLAINDANYTVTPTINGKQVRCPFYTTWRRMLERCYSEKCQARKPTYIGCTVCREWLTFSNFRSWMVGQDWRGKDLDKDLIYPGNKVYSPKTCIFVSREINTLINDRAAARGKHKIGVYLIKNTGRYRAKLVKNMKFVSLGCFGSEKEANEAYIKAKAEYILEVAELQAEPLRSALIRRAKLLTEEAQPTSQKEN